MIEKQSEFDRFCERLKTADLIAFDTEFVGEDYFRPKLCLIQVATREGIEIVDALQVREVTPFWEVLVSGSHTTVFHAGQHELRFCMASTGRRPRNLFDVQLAAGLLGWEFPASYSNLVSRALGEDVGKSQTRTDWRRRPLRPAQLKYAAQDVEHLIPLYENLDASLKRLGRRPWLDEEIERMELAAVHSESNERWKKTPGIQSLSREQLAIVRSLWRWRESEAEKLNRPPRRVLRDDLIIELAKLGSSSRTQIKSIREMTQNRFSKHLEAISSAIQRALDLSDHQQPRKIRRPIKNRYPGMTGQFLNLVLSAICQENEISPGLVGSMQDLHDLLAWVESPDEQRPKLASGWRGELIGNQLQLALQGKLSVRIDHVDGDPVPVIEAEP